MQYIFHTTASMDTCAHIFQAGQKRGRKCVKAVWKDGYCGSHDPVKLTERAETYAERAKMKLISKPQKQECNYVIRRGEYKGQICGKKSDGERCVLHRQNKIDERKRQAAVAYDPKKINKERRIKRGGKAETVLTRELFNKTLNDYKVLHSVVPHNHVYDEGSLMAYFRSLRRISKDCFGVIQTDADINIGILSDPDMIEKCLKKSYAACAQRDISLALHVISRAYNLLTKDRYAEMYRFFDARAKIEQGKKEYASPTPESIMKKADEQYEIYLKKPTIKNMVNTALAYAYAESPALRAGDTTGIVFGENNTTEEYPNYVTDDMKEMVLREHKNTVRTLNPIDKSKLLKEERRVPIGERLGRMLRDIKGTGTKYAFPRKELDAGLTTSMVSKATMKVLGITPNVTRKASCLKSYDKDVTIEEFNALAKGCGHTAKSHMIYYEGKEMGVEDIRKKKLRKSM